MAVPVTNVYGCNYGESREGRVRNTLNSISANVPISTYGKTYILFGRTSVEFVETDIPLQALGSDVGVPGIGTAVELEDLTV